MYSTILGISALLLGIFAMNLGFGLQSSLLGIRAGIEGFPIPVTGAIMAMYYVGYLGGTTLGPKLVHKVGHVRVFAAMASLASTVALLHAVFVNPVTWTLLRIMTGFCIAGLLLVTESWLNHASTNSNRGSVLSIYMVVSLGSVALGQLLLNVAPVDSQDLFILVSVLVSLSLLPIVLTTRIAPTLIPKPRMRLLNLFAISPMGTVGCFATGLIHGAFWGMGAVFAHLSGLDNKGISIFMAFVVLGGMLSQWPVGYLSDRIDRRIVLLGLAGAVMLVSVAMASAGSSLSHAMLFALGWVYGAAMFPLYAISIAHVNDLTNSEDFVPTSSALLLVYAMGAAMGPFAAGWAMDGVGPGGMFYYTAAVSFMLGAFTLKRLYFGRAIMPSEKEGFIAVPHTTAQATEMAGQVSDHAAEGKESGERNA
jgi:MFS family permease